MMWEIGLALAAALWLGCCGKGLALRLLTPVQGLVILLPGGGDGRQLEQQIKGLRALAQQGVLSHTRILLADQGLDAQGVALAQALCRRYPEVTLCPPETAAAFIPKER